MVTLTSQVFWFGIAVGVIVGFILCLIMVNWQSEY